MVTEIAIFHALPGKEDELGQAILKGIEVIRQHPECISAKVERCIEQPGQYMLIVIWTSYEAHVDEFPRRSTLPPNGVVISMAYLKGRRLSITAQPF